MRRPSHCGLRRAPRAERPGRRGGGRSGCVGAEMATTRPARPRFSAMPCVVPPGLGFGGIRFLPHSWPPLLGARLGLALGAWAVCAERPGWRRVWLFRRHCCALASVFRRRFSDLGICFAGGRGGGGRAGVSARSTRYRAEPASRAGPQAPIGPPPQLPEGLDPYGPGSCCLSAEAPAAGSHIPYRFLRSGVRQVPCPENVLVTPSGLGAGVGNRSGRLPARTRSVTSCFWPLWCRSSACQGRRGPRGAAR